MHETLVESIKGNIDKTEIREKKEIIEGWCFDLSLGILPLRAQSKSTIIYPKKIKRSDVMEYYGNNESIEECGWILETPHPQTEKYKLEIKRNDVWQEIMEIPHQEDESVTLIDPLNKKIKPSFVVVDNFYQEPDKIREYALNQDFVANIKYHKGKRSIDPKFRFPGLKERFEEILNRKIKNWENYPVNGCFQYCVAEDKSVYHVDCQEYAGIIYLTPDAPPECGTCFYRSKKTHQMRISPNDSDYSTIFEKGFYDSTQFDLVDVVGNVYNRLILFDSQTIHAAPTYFGQDLHDARLFQLFFFDLEP